MKRKHTHANKLAAAGLSLLLALTLAPAGAMPPAAALTEPVDGNYFFSDYENKEETLAAGKQFVTKIAEEGMTLLKNDGSLPLKAGAKLSVFGKNSVDLVYGGSGAGGVAAGAESVNLQDSLAEAGFSVNPALTAFYKDVTQSGPKRPEFSGKNLPQKTYETPLSQYTATVEASYSAYKDAAIVVVSRAGGEGFDLPRDTAANFGIENSHYFQLDKNEADLIKYCGDRFDNVIVLLNVGSQFECGFLDDPTHYGYHENVKGALWVGFPGGMGFRALGRILNGTVNPSGRTVDTYARRFKDDPTYQNFATNFGVNAYATGGSGAFVRYEEGIYVGYRYYETRGYTEREAALQANPDAAEAELEAWYDDAVVYPFGYGLSYTDFEWTVVSSSLEDGATLPADGTVEMRVRVTNTGTTAGKEVVQLYYTAPYTPGGIEKAHVVLGDFAKTDLIEPGASDEVTVSLKVRDMASYDFNDANGNDFTGYELDGGNYTLRLMKNAHEHAAQKTYTIPDGGYTYPIDDVTENPVDNKFDYVSAEIKVYMSRNDFAGTFPAPSVNDKTGVDSDSRVMSAAAKAQAGYIRSDSADKPWYTTTAPTQAEGSESVGDIKLADMAGLAPDDPKWDEFMNQFVVGDLTDANLKGLVGLVSKGGYQTIGIPGLGIPGTTIPDGPAGFRAQGTDQSKEYVAYASETLVSSTWNKQIAYDMGVMLGNEGLHGGGNAKYPRHAGLYAPACNIHRSPFGGRNFEYYSEDGLLSAVMATEVVKGARTKGLITTVKHFAINDQETNRQGVYTWASEQSMREIYFKPFEWTVKYGETLGIMSSFNRVGSELAGGCYNLLTGVLRDEWGFDGLMVTDYYANATRDVIRAGGDLMLYGYHLNHATEGDDITSPIVISALRESAKHICYALANSMALNAGNPQLIESFQPAALPYATVGTAYEQSVAAVTVNDGGDPADAVYSLSPGSRLPEGLSLSADGTISGTPTESVNGHRFAVTVGYRTATAEAVCTITVAGESGSIVYELDSALSPGRVGEPYNAGLGLASLTKGEEEIVYAVSPDAVLPEGLTLSPAGVLSGTPLKPCDGYEIRITASAPGFDTVTATTALTIHNSLTYEAVPLSDAKYGVTYTASVAFAETDGTGAVTYALKVKDGEKLPSGLTLTPAGYVTGLPRETGSAFRFTVVAAAPDCADVEATFTLSVGLTYLDVTAVDGKAGEDYIGYVSFAQGAGSVTYAVKEGSVLPEGMSLSADGELTGTPAKAGNYAFVVTASAEGRAGAEATVYLFVADAEPSGKGCGGAAAGSAAGMAGVLIGAACLLLKKRKRSDKC